MSTTPASVSSLPVAKTKLQAIALYARYAGAAAFLVGVVLSAHHYAIGICFVGGAAAFYAGKKLRGA
jgi:hypothetical protein